MRLRFVENGRAAGQGRAKRARGAAAIQALVNGLGPEYTAP
jgi:hypothetical protein